jgi:hypothetical protein
MTYFEIRRESRWGKCSINLQIENHLFKGHNGLYELYINYGGFF